jgi:hypothetical protein
MISVVPLEIGSGAYSNIFSGKVDIFLAESANSLPYIEFKFIKIQ